jgi:hypothetical protein
MEIVGEGDKEMFVATERRKKEDWNRLINSYFCPRPGGVCKWEHPKQKCDFKWAKQQLFKSKIKSTSI